MSRDGPRNSLCIAVQSQNKRWRVQRSTGVVVFVNEKDKMDLIWHNNNNN